MKSKTEFFFHNLKTLQIDGPFESGKPDKLCQHIEDQSLPDGEWMVTEHVTEVSENDFSHALDMWRHKKKTKKKDVEGEKSAPLIIKGEVIG